MSSPTLVWFRRDLRCDDHPALVSAAAQGPVVALYIDDRDGDGEAAPGAAARWWLHHSLVALRGALHRLNIPLVIERGPSLERLRHVARAVGARTIRWNRRYEPDVVARDTHIKATLLAEGFAVHSHAAALLREPWQVLGSEAWRERVAFAHFWRHYDAWDAVPRPLDPPAAPPRVEPWPVEAPIDTLGLLPTIPWDREFGDHWTPGEPGAVQRWASALADGRARIRQARPAVRIDDGSTLAPHIAWGELSVRRIWWDIARAESKRDDVPSPHADPWLRQVAWRDYCVHLLWHRPDVTRAPVRADAPRVSWRHAPDELRRWRFGRTGYPTVDAGMRQLRRTGYLPNRARMVVASFLTHHLLLDWRDGEAWFRDHLLDFEQASNVLNWQWSAGTGTDPAPFRMFNPVLQGHKFDPDGQWTRRWIPELAQAPAAWIHAPWQAPALDLLASGVTLGDTWPHPMVDHDVARRRAAAAFGSA